MQKTKLVFLYLIGSLIWLYATNYILVHFIPSSLNHFVERGKEIFYILVTGGIFYFFILKKEELDTTKEQEKRLSTLINSMVDFVNFKDGDGRWIQANDFGLKLFQLENVDYLGKKDSELAKYTDFYAEALTFCEKSDQETWEKGEVARCEEVVPLPDGTSKIFDTIKVPLFHEDGSREGLVIIGRDITALRQTEERLSRTEKLSVVGELSASIAHEIRNPMTTVQGFLQLSRNKVDNLSTDIVDLMLEELYRANSIITEFLNLAKNKISVKKKQNLNAIIEALSPLIQAEAFRSNKQLKLELGECPDISLDEKEIRQLILNIALNGLDSMTSNGSLTIKTYKDKETVVLQIKDEGQGISPEVLSKLGTPFFTTKETGTGLGLAICYSVAKRHDAQIEIETSEKGTTFSARFQLIPSLTNA
ncbi:ATP-binding protein [Neobacillus niacini]|uniref:ATP-binding protein n=1 Tax=Neobacillus niacini TaxID=86668 RepID=UPI002FFE513F